MIEKNLEQLANALEVLDPKERDLIILHYYTKMPLKQIAQKMKISDKAAELLHRNALNQLKKLL